MWRPVQWRIQGGGLIVRPDPPLLLSTDCEFLDNVCTVFVSLFRDWTVKSVSQGIYSITIRVFCLLKTVSKCTQTYHFGDKNDFFLGRGPATSTTPSDPTPSTPMAPCSLLTEILNMPLVLYVLAVSLVIRDDGLSVHMDVDTFVDVTTWIAYTCCYIVLHFRLRCSCFL